MISLFCPVPSVLISGQSRIDSRSEFIDLVIDLVEVSISAKIAKSYLEVSDLITLIC